MSVVTVVALVGGLILLVASAQVLVRGASDIARSFGIPSLIVGLTVVAYGTSAPEMAVSVSGAASGEHGVALGNVLGSTVANILLILGISAVITSLVVAKRIVRVEVPIMLGIAILAFLLARDGSVSRVDGLTLIGVIGAYTWFVVSGARRDSRASSGDGEQSSSEQPIATRRTSVLRVLAGLVGLVIGSQLLVGSAVDIATALGLSEVIIGLTIVAIGTSLPEVATSIAAALKGDRDIAIGNVIGSNIFNMSLVLGLAGVVAPGGLDVPDSVLAFDFPVMLAVCIASLPVFFTGHCVKRWEGVVFLGYYAAYIAYLVLDETEHTQAELFGAAITVFALPLTAITLLLFVVREGQHIRLRRRNETVLDLTSSDAEREPQTLR